MVSFSTLQNFSDSSPNTILISEDLFILVSIILNAFCSYIFSIILFAIPVFKLAVLLMILSSGSQLRILKHLPFIKLFILKEFLKQSSLYSFTVISPRYDDSIIQLIDEKVRSAKHTFTNSFLNKIYYYSAR